MTSSNRKRSRTVSDPCDLAEDVVTLSGGHMLPVPMQELWRKRKLCDAEICVGDCHFAAHRVVLAAGSDYFAALYCRAETADTEGELKLADISPSAFAAVLEFLYSGTCTLGPASLVPVLEAAARFHVDLLKEAAVSAIISRLSPDSAIGAWSLAERHSLTTLEQAARSEVLSCFDAHANNGAVASLSRARLCSLLVSDGLATASEESLFEAVEAWHGAQQPPPSTSELVEVLDCIRFPLMRSDFVSSRVMASPMLQTTRAANVVVQALLEDRSGAETSRTRPRVGAGAIFLLGGENASFHCSDNQQCLSTVACLRNSEWAFAPPMKSMRTTAAAATLRGKLYVLGGFDGSHWLRSVLVFDPQLGWSEGPPLGTARSWLCAAVLDGKLYAIGGFCDGEQIATVEVFDPTVGNWTEVAPLPTARSSTCCAVLNERLYVIGGDDLDVVEVYDPSTDAWSDGPHMSTARANASAAVLDGKLYVVGGTGEDHAALASMLVLDPATGRWAEGPPMPAGRTEACAVVLAGILHVMGGTYDDDAIDVGEAYADSVALYDPRSARWSEGPKMHAGFARARASAAVVKVASHGSLFQTADSAPLSGSPSLPIDGS